jgi:integrase
MAITRKDLDYERGTARLPARQKGAGSPGLTVPLTEQAVAALKELERLGGLGERFSRKSLWQSFQRAAITAGYPGVRPYDLRHSFLSAVALMGDEGAVQALGQHQSRATTQRYIVGSLAERLQAAVVRAFGKSPSDLTPKSPTKAHAGKRTNRGNRQRPSKENPA